MQFKFILASLLWLLPFTLSAVDNTLPYPLVNPTFNGVLGGHQVSLNGTIQEMMAQMVAMHPEFDPESLKKHPLTRRDGVHQVITRCPAL